MNSKKRLNFKVKSRTDRIQSVKVLALILIIGGEFAHLSKEFSTLSKKSGVSDRSNFSSNQVRSAAPESLDSTKSVVLAVGSNLGLPGVNSVEQQGKMLSISLQSDRFFKFGTATLNSDALGAIAQIAGKIQNTFSRVRIEIEGHTDDSPVLKQKKQFQSNWELSLARAAAVLHVFEESGIPKSNLKVAGFGDSQPMVPNRNERGELIPENLVRNRRIIVRILDEMNGEAAQR